MNSDSLIANATMQKILFELGSCIWNLHPVLKVKVYYNCNKCRRLAEMKNDYNWNESENYTSHFPIVSNNLGAT